MSTFKKRIEEAVSKFPEQKELLKTLWPDHFEPENPKFDVGEWYIYLDRTLIKIGRVDGKNFYASEVYGIDKIDWFQGNSYYADKLDRATTKQVRELMSKEITRRGYKKGVKVECLGTGKIGILSENYFVYNGAFGKEFGSHSLESSFDNTMINGILYLDGKWAKILPSETILTKEEAITKLKELTGENFNIVS